MTSRREKIAAQDVILAAIGAAAASEEKAGRVSVAKAVRDELARLSARYGILPTETE